MLFKFIAPLVQEGEDDDELDDEVSGWGKWVGGRVGGQGVTGGAVPRVCQPRSHACGRAAGPAAWRAAAQDIEAEQVMVARLLHQLTCDDTATQFAILRAARAHLELGGPARMRHTLPALAFCALKAIRRLPPPSDAERAAAAEAASDAAGGSAGAGGGAEAVSMQSALQWLLEVALQLAEVPAPMPALRLLLVCAHVCSEEAGLEMLAYEFCEQVGGRWVVGRGWCVGGALCAAGRGHALPALQRHTRVRSLHARARPPSP
jgi:hypothetical protein